MTASVNVQPIVGESLDPRRAKMLQKLVAHAVNMKPEDVNVTNLGDGGAYGAGGDIPPEIFESEYYQTKVAFEMQKRESIMNHLRHIPGVHVEVNAELNDTAEEVTTSDQARSEGHRAARSRSRRNHPTQFAGAPAGQPGTSSKGPDRQAADGGAGKQERNHERNDRNGQRRRREQKAAR